MGNHPLMTCISRPISRSTMCIGRDQRGITGLETAIVLIAFVVVASVFAFAVLSTGLVSSEKSKETILGALSETSATLVLKGSVVAVSTSTPSSVTNVKFQLTNASKAGSAVNLSTSGTNAAVVTYTDESQTSNLSTWTATWLSGSGSLVNPGETVEIDADISGITTKLGVATEFTIQVRPAIGAVITIKRKTPAELSTVMDLN